MTGTTATTTQATKPPTPEQLGQAADIGSHAITKTLKAMEADFDGVQQLIDSGDQLRSVIEQTVRKIAQVQTFQDEEVGFNPKYDYPKAYQGPAAIGIAQQTNILRQHFPGIGFANMDLLAKIQAGTAKLPPGAEGWFAIPRWQAIAPTYGEALEKIFEKLNATRKFYNYREGALTPKKLRQHSRTAHALDLIAEQQKGYDILLVPAQFGKRHAGRSVRRARAVMRHPEFGMGAFGVGAMLLTHPTRLVHFDNLWIDCPGDEYDYDADGQWSGAPLFSFNDSQLEFDAYWFDRARSRYGSASGFVPQ